MASDYAFLNHKNVYAQESLTVSTTSIGGTTSLIDNHLQTLAPQKASAAVIQPVSNAIYYTLDGSTPTSTNGHLLPTNEVLAIAGYGKIKRFRAVRSAGADAVVNVAYYNG